MPAGLEQVTSANAMDLISNALASGKLPFEEMKKRIMAHGFENLMAARERPDLLLSIAHELRTTGMI